MCDPAAFANALPSSTMDILSGTLKSIRFEGALFFDADFTAPGACAEGTA